MYILPPLREQVISYCVEETWMRSYFGSWGEVAYVSRGAVASIYSEILGSYYIVKTTLHNTTIK